MSPSKDAGSAPATKAAPKAASSNRSFSYDPATSAPSVRHSSATWRVLDERAAVPRVISREMANPTRLPSRFQPDARSGWGRLELSPREYRRPLSQIDTIGRPEIGPKRLS